MKIIVTGATGTAGSEVIRQAIADNNISSITAIARRPLDVQHPKLTTIIHKDFLDYTGLDNIFQSHDACIWCLGISQTQVSKEQYEVITFLYTLKAAQAMLHANHNIGFVFLSGDGADPEEKSRTTFARIKGRTEKALTSLEFKKLYIARPGGIWPVHKNPNAAFLNRLVMPLFPVLSRIFPTKVIKSDALAKALIQLARQGHSKRVLDNEELKEFSK